MFRTNKQYAPDPEGATGGGGTPPSSGTPPAGPTGDKGTPGDNGKPDPSTETAELQALIGKGTLSDTEKARLTELQSKYDATPIGADGKPLTPEQIASIKEVETKVNAILAKEESARTPEEVKFLLENTEEEGNNKSIYEQVDELRGELIEVEYGDVDPLSPEGILLREETIADKAAEAAQEEIRARFPRAYALMLHLSQGGKEEDFFKPQNQDFSKVTITTEDKAGQENILRTALALKGNSPTIIDVIITSLKDKGALEATAKTELEALQQSQKQRETQLAAKAREIKAKEVQDLGKLATDLQTSVEKGFDGVVVPVKDRKDFIKFIGERINYNNGEFHVVSKLDPKELNKVLKVAYFEFKGGDINSLADRTAKTLIARKLKNGINYSIVPKGTGGTPNRNVPLSQL